MGYDTFFNVNITAPTKKEHFAVLKEIAEAADQDIPNVNYGFEGHWYDWDADLAAISARHPGVLIEAGGNGEDSNDIWAARYRDGKSEIIRFEGLPDFKEILTSQEEEVVFRKTSEAYREALDNLTKSALRRIRTLKDHITEGPDKFLWLNRLNDHCPQLVIADGLSLSHVTGIHDDGETLSTEQDPVDVKDLLPDDLRDLVDLLEGIVKEIEKGDIKGVWNDDEEWYELYYATDGEED